MRRGVACELHERNLQACYLWAFRPEMCRYQPVNCEGSQKASTDNGFVEDLKEVICMCVFISLPDMPNTIQVCGRCNNLLHRPHTQRSLPRLACKRKEI